jgi:hypothetical protein
MCFFLTLHLPLSCFTHGERMLHTFTLTFTQMEIIHLHLTCMSKTRCTHNMGLSQCCVVFAFLKHHLAHILKFKHNPFSVSFIQCFWKIKVLIKPQFVVPCDGFGFFANFIFNCFFVMNYALSLCKTFDYVWIRFNAKFFLLEKSRLN